MLKTLRDAGYVEMKNKAEGGVDYVIYDTPQQEPLTENTEVDKSHLRKIPLREKPLTDNPTLVNTDKTTKTEKDLVNTESVAHAEAVADYLASKIKNNNPKTRPNPSAWVADIEKAIRIDGRTVDDLIAIIDWMYEGDAFWSGVVLSGKKLREKFDAMIMQEKRNGTQRNQAVSGQVKSKSTSIHERNRSRYQAALEREQSDRADNAIEREIRPQVQFVN